MLTVRRGLLLLLLLGSDGNRITARLPAPRLPAGRPSTSTASTARIYRDEWGIPHIFAPTNRALFEAYGYTVAEDRLFQLEIDRRAARGTLAEVFGPSFVEADEVARRDGYTDAELDAQIRKRQRRGPGDLQAYLDGINRYINDVVDKDPEHKLPYEFKVLGFTPAPWTGRDSAAFGAFMVRRFGEIGGGELENQSLLRRPGRGARPGGGMGHLQRPDLGQRRRLTRHDPARRVSRLMTAARSGDAGSQVAAPAARP